MHPQYASQIKLFSTNGAGIKNGKVESLNAEVRSTKSNIVTVQETHCSEKGRIKMDREFVIFEAIRKKKGGGTLVAIHEDLNPKLIEEYHDEFELLVVEVSTKEKSIRVISGYGPQENLDEEKRLPFFIALETEIEKAELAGKSVIVEMDANAKLGPKYIAKDPHGITPNGSLLAGIIERHSLNVGNGAKECKCTITRKKVTRHKTEERVIDIVLFSPDLRKYFISMHVDEERKHVLTRICKTKTGVKVKESDHNVLLAELNSKLLEKDKPQNDQVYNLKNKRCQADFKKYTLNINMLSSTIKEEGDINQVIQRFMKKVDGCIAVNFSKMRVKKKKGHNEDELYAKMRSLKNKEDAESVNELAKCVETIATAAKNNYRKVKDELAKIKPNEGKMDNKQVWKLKKALCPSTMDTPCAMNDANGNLITSDKALEKRALQVYAERLEGNTMEDHLKDLEKETNLLCELRVKVSKENKTEPWTMDDMKEVLNHLKKDKSRDPEGWAYELFKEETAGTDLLEALLKLMNLIKSKQESPTILEKCNITSIHKKKIKT